MSRRLSRLVSESDNVEVALSVFEKKQVFKNRSFVLPIAGRATSASADR